MDFGALPPEINSARMYFGPGSAPMLAAAAGWEGVADELRSTAATYQSVISLLTDEDWLGPTSVSMAAAVAPYLTWMRVTGAQAEQAATNAVAAAGAFEAAFAMTVPPPEVAANRAQLAALVASNVIGQNTPAIAATEAQYGEMWAQDAAAMYGYAASSAGASVLKPFGQPAQVTSLAGPAEQAAAVLQNTGTAAASATQAALARVTSALPAALQSLASPLTALQASALWPFLDSNFVNGFVSAGYTSPAILQQTVTASMADLNAVAIGSQPQATPSLPPMGSGSGNEGWAPLATPVVPYSSAIAPVASAGMSTVNMGGVSAVMARGALVGQLSVPPSWTAVTQVVNHSGVALPGGGWTGTVLPESSSGVPGMPGIPAVSTAAHHFGSGPRYGFRPTVMARPPAAG